MTMTDKAAKRQSKRQTAKYWISRSDKKKLLPPRPPQSTAGAGTASMLQGCAPPTLAVQHDKGTRGEHTRDSMAVSATQLE